MKTYIGTKQINAVEMTRLAYNTLRGWEVPLDENPADKGYLVEYPDSPNANHPDYKGYISWSPENVFKGSYKIAETPEDKLRIEWNELGEKIMELDKLNMQEENSDIDEFEKSLLRVQAGTMFAYYQCLTERLSKYDR